MKKPIGTAILILALLPAPAAVAQSQSETFRQASGSPGTPPADSALFLSHNEQGRALSRGLAPVPRPAATPSAPAEPQEPGWIARLVSRIRAMLLGEAGPG